ncbi:MAG: chemotaxis protein CheC [Thermacetogeniaceae bacterium]
MMDPWKNLNAFHIDVLREIGNIGAGNAATALATMLGRRIQMSVPRAGVLPIGEIPHLIGDEEEPVVCVNFVVKGSAPGKILFLLDEVSALKLVDMLMGLPQGTTVSVDDMARSVIMETGNILTGSFLTAFADFCRLQLLPSVPALAHDMLGAVLSSAFLEGGYFSDKALVTETTFYAEDVSLKGHFFFIPEADSLGVILKSLGVEV